MGTFDNPFKLRSAARKVSSRTRHSADKRAGQIFDRAPSKLRYVPPKPLTAPNQGVSKYEDMTLDELFDSVYHPTARRAVVRSIVKLNPDDVCEEVKQRMRDKIRGSALNNARALKEQRLAEKIHQDR